MAIERSVSARAASGRAPSPAQRPSLERSGSLARLQPEEVVPVAELAEQGGRRFPAVVARFGADLYAYSAQWLTQLREQLEEEQAEAGQGAGR
jgi:hypothetical protein